MTNVNSPVIIDTDGGVDDVLALRLALLLNPSLLSITTVGGNVSAFQAAQTVSFMTGVPAHVGLNPPSWEPEGRHGQDGIHGHWDGCERSVASHDAVDVIAKALVTPGAVIACLGPLTNVAAALRMVDDPSKVQAETIVALGGVQSAPAGVRDTNRMLDVMAAEECDEFLTWVSMADAANRSAIKIADVQKSSDWSWIAPFAHRTSQTWGWPDQFPVYDAAIVGYALSPGCDVGEGLINALA